MQEEQEIQFLYQALTEKFLDFNVFRTAPRQLEILPKGVSKGENPRENHGAGRMDKG